LVTHYFLQFYIYTGCKRACRLIHYMPVVGASEVVQSWKKPNSSVVVVTVMSTGNKVTMRREFLLYDINMLLANVGGLAGMFLGGSLLSAYDIFMAFVNKIWYKC